MGREGGSVEGSRVAATVQSCTAMTVSMSAQVPVVVVRCVDLRLGAGGCVCVCACDRRPACACVPRPDTSDTRASRDAAPCAGMVLVGMPPGAGRATPCSTVWTGYMYHDICRSTYTIRLPQ